MFPNNSQRKQASNKEDDQTSGNRKTGPSARPREQALKCPRCDSENTKFCYYNNYSLTQPRHFCKTCRRYWTKGGSIRSVPIGGGCRKNKKIKSSSRLSSADSIDSTGSSGIGGFKFFHGISPAMDFNLCGLSFPKLNPSSSGLYNQFSSFGDISSSSDISVTNSCFNLDPQGSIPVGSFMGFSSPLSPISTSFSSAVHDDMGGGGGGGMSGGGSMYVNTKLASSIESLSCMNQDLHWKLQQQRLAMIFGGDDHKQNNSFSIPIENQPQKLQSITFHNLEISKPEVSSIDISRKEGTDTATEWFFGNSYGQLNQTPTKSSSNGHDDNTNWNGVEAWSDFHQRYGFPYTKDHHPR